MATIIGALATSHAPQLIMPALKWPDLPTRTKGPFKPKPDIGQAAPRVPQREPRRAAVYFRGYGFVPAPIVQRDTLAPRERLHGPAIVVEDGSTTLVEPGMALQRTEEGFLLLETGVAPKGEAPSK